MPRVVDALPLADAVLCRQLSLPSSIDRTVVLFKNTDDDEATGELRLHDDSYEKSQRGRDDYYSDETFDLHPDTYIW